ncbi:hypothetical protein FRC06_001186, partial [Ceratobasidium sp. 370]
MSSQTIHDSTTLPPAPLKIDPGIQVTQDSSAETAEASPSTTILTEGQTHNQTVGGVENSEAKNKIPVNAGPGQPETVAEQSEPQSKTDADHSVDQNREDKSFGLENPASHDDKVATADGETPEDVDNHDQATVLGKRGDTFYDQYEESGNLEDIVSAIECYSQAILLTPEGHADEPKWVGNLGASYNSRFQALGKLADLDMAIGCNTRALLLTPEESSGRSIRLNNLGASYLRRYESRNQLSDLNMAIDYQSEAVLLAPETHPDRPAWLSNLGIFHLTRFQRLKDVADLDKAIGYTNQAVLLKQGEDQSEAPVLLSNLSTAYQIRYDLLGNLADSDMAIHNMKRALSLAPEGHPS